MVVLIATATLVVATGASLPEVVASHFGPGGQADGFMTRTGYVTFMLVILLGAAALFWGLPKLLRVLPTASFNLPNRDYWLAPERRDATLDDMERRLRWFACALLVFLAYVHYLVVQANAVQPPVLPERAFFLGMAGLVAAVIAWAVAFIRRFRRTGGG